jgi:cellulase/cellobiase CelA1
VIILTQRYKKMKYRDSQPLATSPKATDPDKKAARKNDRAYKKLQKETLRKNVKQVKEMPAAKWEATPAAKEGVTKKQGIRGLKKAVRKTFR